MLQDKEVKPNKKLLHLNVEKMLKIRVAMEKVVGKYSDSAALTTG